MRIYLDKQILSHLFKAEKPEYKNLLPKLYNSKSHLLFCYSQAHLLDLKNDKTQIKYKELEFIESIVDDNYLCHNSKDKKTYCYLAKPTVAFSEINISDEKIDLNSLFLDKSYFDDEQKIFIDRFNYFFNEFKFDLSFLSKNEISEDLKKALDKLLPNKETSLTTVDILNNFTNGLEILNNDKTAYKELRQSIDQSFNNGKFTLDYNNIDFNDDLKNSDLKKTFIDFVKGTIGNNIEISRFDFFTKAYLSLDLLGISKEPSKSVKFRNMVNDSIHSYYGGYCDIVVSDDNGFLKKTKALYKLLSIETKVLHIDEFIRTYTFMINNKEIDSKMFVDLLANDLQNGLVVNTKKSLKFNRETKTIKLSHNYLGQFNYLDDMIEDDKKYLYLYRKTNNYSDFMFFREFESIINNAVKLFGSDCNFQEEFIWNNEISEIKNGKWKGRYWDLGKLTILIDINEGTKEIGMQFAFPNL